MKKLITLLLVAIPMFSHAQVDVKIKTDTTFNHVYSDVKSAINAMGESLKVGAEHVYQVVVRQQFVDAITWTVVLVAMFLFILIFLFAASQLNDDGSETCMGIALIMGVVFMITFCFVIDIIVTGFVNPEYGAIKDITEFIK